MMNWKGFGRKQLCPDLNYIPSVFLELQRETPKNLSG
jgi:hypothetical protein